MWLTHMDSEVSKFHPVCEKALLAALKKIGIESEYEVLHHEYIGSLEMDFVIQNIKTGRYLCIIEVKRTPADIHSARYQSQAMSYVMESSSNLEKPFYILTNLEYAFVFRYDSSRPRVVQQILEPGLIYIGDFSVFEEEEFTNELTNFFADLISDFLTNTYSYQLTLEQFERHMNNIKNNAPKWKSSLVVLLYEYIRGAFITVGRNELPHDVRKFQNNVERICREAATVNFKDIFSFSTGRYDKRVSIESEMLSSIYSFGKQSTSGDSVASVLHSIVSEDMKHYGEVQTDLELARIVAILAKIFSGNIREDDFICDPAAGSGNLITSAIDVFNISPRQIKANDSNEKLLELLSLRIGLNFAKVVSEDNSAEISARNIIDLPSEYFDDVRVVLMNPPFVAGINCVTRKKELFKRIHEIKRKKACTEIGQMNLEGAFLETVCALCNDNTVISCVFPKTHLVARGAEGVALRKFLLDEFGLVAIFSYPEEGLFEDVVKGTCVIVGKVRVFSDVIKVVSSNGKVADIDLHMFEKAIAKEFSSVKFTHLMPGLDGLVKSKDYFHSAAGEGWRHLCREFEDADFFVKLNIKTNRKLMLLRSIHKNILPRKRGPSANKGAGDLIQLSMDTELYKKYSKVPTLTSIKSPKNFNCVLIENGDTVCFNASKINDKQLNSIISDYLTIPPESRQQQKKTKSKSEILAILKSDSSKAVPAMSVLLPRLLRGKGKVFINTVEAIISTNFYTLNAKDIEDAMVLASWCSTIFYQLICEISSKPQEGGRKMEGEEYKETYMPIIEKLSKHEKDSLVSEISNIEFLELNNPKVRKIDEIWSTILFGAEAKNKVIEAKRLLEFLANTRNPNAISDD